MPTPAATEDLAAAACCGIGVSGGLSAEQAQVSAALLKALADPVRLRLVSLIRDSPGQAACVCDLTPAVGLSQPTVSHHLKVLSEAGLLRRERRGTWAWFHLVPERVAQAADILR